MRTLIPLSLLLVTTTLVATPILQAQDTEEAPEPFVYVLAYVIPWERVDSLTTLLQKTSERVAKAKEMGYLIDWQTWIHRHGDEWNVLTVRTYASEKAWASNPPGWQQSVREMIIPDSTRRAAINAGFAWVFDGTSHRDNMYRVLP